MNIENNQEWRGYHFPISTANGNYLLASHFDSVRDESGEIAKLKMHSDYMPQCWRNDDDNYVHSQR